MNLIIDIKNISKLSFFIFISNIISSKQLNFEFSKNTPLINENNLLIPKKIYNNSDLTKSFYKQKSKIKSLRFLEVSKCKESNEESNSKSLCISCNTNGGYYPIYYDYNYDNSKENIKTYLDQYIDCYNQDSKPSNYYFNSKLQAYEKCYESCKSCSGYGDQNNNNCDSCNDNYIFKPEVNSSKNCVLRCQYYYYYNSVGEYTCTEYGLCPPQLNLAIEDKKKCVSDCNNDNEFKYQYNGECLSICPENTVTMESSNICLDININKCVLTVKYTQIKGSNVNHIMINELAKRYVKEYSYTQNHVSQFIADNYVILFYRNKSCLPELHLNSSIMDLESCITRIKGIYHNISSPLIAVIDKMGAYNNPSLYYSFYHPNTGEKLYAYLCDNITIKVKKNVSSLYPKGRYDWLTRQNIDVFFYNDSFFINICTHYESFNKKDIILVDRLKMFYISSFICDNNCVYNGTDYTTLTTTCICNYTEANIYLINVNLDSFIKMGLEKVIEIYSDVFSKLERYKVFFVSCFRDVFTFKYFIRNLGGFIILALILIQVICLIFLASSCFFNKLDQFIISVTNSYTNYLKKIHRMKRDIQYKKNSIKSNLNNETNDENYKSSLIENSKKQESRNFKNVDAKEKLDNSLTSNDNTKKVFETSELVSKRMNEKPNYKKHYNKRNNSTLDINNFDYFDKYYKTNSFNEIDMRDYLYTSPDEMSFNNSIKKDKRTFCTLLLNRIVKKQIIAYTFFMIDETIPIYLKIISMTLYIDIFFLSIAILYFPSEISLKFILYSADKKKYKRMVIILALLKVTYSFLIATGIRFLMELFFANNITIKKVLKREKDDEKVLRNEINKLIICIKIRYIFFIIIDLFLMLVSWYYICCFNNVYSYTKIEWCVICIIAIFASQILLIVISFIETCFRFVAIKLKCEFLFYISEFFKYIF